MSDIKRHVQSPCIRNCCLNDEEVCLGCFRMLDEITRWSEAEDAERSVILEQAKVRKAAHYADMKKRQS